MGDKIKPLWNLVKEKVVDRDLDENPICDSDIEFYYCAGQLTRYLISLSQAQKVNYNALDPLLNARDSNKLKYEIINLLKKYSYAVNLASKRANAMLSMVMGYEPEDPENLMLDAFIAGLASQNIIYYSDGKNKKGEDKK